MPPTVSVVVSVYNGEQYLRPSLQSVLSQQGVDLELIVVDDGSTDASGPVLDELEQSDPRVRVFHQENQGLTQALIRGCAESRGEYIARHDADDLSLPDRLRRQVVLLAGNPALSMVSCWARALGPCDEILWETRRPGDSATATDQLLNQWQGPPGHGSVMFRRSAYERVGGYRPEFYYAQDGDLWLRLAEVGPIAYEPEFLFAYRIDDGSISSRHRTIQHQIGALAHECQAARRVGRSEEEILDRAARLRPGLVPSGKADPVAGAYFIGRCLLKRRDGRARNYFRKVLARRPWSLRAWASLVQSHAISSRT